MCDMTHFYVWCVQVVHTISMAAGNLWHFAILFFVLNFGFIALGMAQFATEREEFSTPVRSFETLWEALLGSMLESGAIPSARWSFNPLIFIYLICYNFFMFMIMLNFIIAIISDAYIKVMESVVDFEAEQESFTDMISVIFMSVKSLVLRWPAHRELIDGLKQCPRTNVDYGVLRRVFPQWKLRFSIFFFELC